jgi:formylglycine-generating enzyme required for sulfatase activity
MKENLMKKIIILGFLSIYFGSCEKLNSVIEEEMGEMPIVKILSPSNAEITGDSVVIDVSAKDNKGIVKVEIYIDNKIPVGGTINVAPYSYVWDCDSVIDASTHSLYAKAYDADDNVVSSSVMTFKVFRFAPTNVKASFHSDSLVQILWNDNSSKETGYVVSQSVNNGPFELVGTVPANITTLNIQRAFQSGDTYSYRVYAMIGTINSNYANSVVYSINYLAPTIKSISFVSTNIVEVKWEDNNDFEKQYDVFSGTDTISMQLVATVPANSTSAMVSGAYSGDFAYYFKVQAVSVYNKSQFSVIELFSKTSSEMIFIQGGSFQMGSNNSIDSYADPVHSAFVSNYYMKRTEVTQAEWKAVVNWKKANGGTTLNPDPNQTKGDDYPVDKVNWNEATLWITHLNEKENTNLYRLPSEAEWEYAARGGNKSKGTLYSGSNSIDDVAWHYNNSGLITHPVAQKMPNELGLYDMSGNVWEMCRDWYAPYTSGEQFNPTGPSNGTTKIYRGGCSLHDTGNRVAFRASAHPNATAYTYGFRYVKMK